AEQRNGGPKFRGESPLRRGRASSFSASPSANPAGGRKRMPNRGYPTILLAAFVAALACLMPATVLGAQTGGAQYKPPPHKARIVHGKAIAPSSAPEKVKEIIAAANKIVTKPYRYGGGYGSWNDSAYDCSGSVSFALHGAHLISQPMDSTEFMSWARSGAGKWVTVHANSGHAPNGTARCPARRRGGWLRAACARRLRGARAGRPRADDDQHSLPRARDEAARPRSGDRRSRRQEPP